MSIIGWGGSALVVLSLLQTRILRLRLLNLIGCVILVGFNLAIGVWPMVGMNAVLAVINVVHLWRLLGHRHDEAEYTVLPVNETDVPWGVDSIPEFVRLHYEIRQWRHAIAILKSDFREELREPSQHSG